MRAGTIAILVLMLAMLAVGGCSPRPVRTVSIGGEPWTVYEGSGDGMRGLPGFGDVDGMLFDPDQDVSLGGAAFTMEGVPYPIDIAWFDATGALVSLAAMAPCMTPPCPLYRAEGSYRWAIEAPPGAFADLGPGDRLVVD
ncbi:MAG: hypothetical protein K0S97_890 [Chloroflexota bacterium]|jgi:uncharacterized membrane protein (UPF0127 family)|nr:hypothetical protein [Chloroflexota bacterium]